MVRRIEVVSYEPSWPEVFAHEAATLAPVFGDLALAIEHAGSTSVPGLPAKPVIDILVVVGHIAPVDALSPRLIDLGYTPQGEYGIPGRRFFYKGTHEVRTHHVHVFADGHVEITRIRDFRDSSAPIRLKPQPTPV